MRRGENGKLGIKTSLDYKLACYGKVDMKSS